MATISTYYGFYAQRYPKVAEAIMNALQTGDMSELLQYEGQVPGIDNVIPAVQQELQNSGPLQNKTGNTGTGDSGNTGAPGTGLSPQDQQPVTPTPNPPTVTIPAAQQSQQQQPVVNNTGTGNTGAVTQQTVTSNTVAPTTTTTSCYNWYSYNNGKQTVTRECH